MKIEVGKYYKTRDGRKVGPMRGFTCGVFYTDDYKYWEDGSVNSTMETNMDLISEWQDEKPSPIRTVTRREIVAGVYGCVEIDVYTGEINVVVDFSGGKCTPEELRESAHILNQIAEALEENGK